MEYDPYRVLGVPRTASREQINAAYKELSRKYNGEKATGGPLAAAAEEKLRELNDAYDRIVMASSADSDSDYIGYVEQNDENYGSGAYSEVSDYEDIRRKIHSGRLDDAAVLLDGIPVGSRNAEWFYLRATVLQKQGWLEEAANAFATARNMEPDNPTYNAAYKNITRSRNGGYRTSSRRREGSDCGVCDVCSVLMCTDCCCECMGGDFIPCC